MGSLIRTTIVTATMLLLLYLLVVLIPDGALGATVKTRVVADAIATFGREGWIVVRPILQLALLLVVVLSLLEKLGIKVADLLVTERLDIRGWLALLVVGTFCLAVLVGGAQMSAVKDVTLVVVGFYFGGLARKRPSPLGDGPLGGSESLQRSSQQGRSEIEP